MCPSNSFWPGPLKIHDVTCKRKKIQAHLNAFHEILVLRTDEGVAGVRGVDMKPGAEFLTDGTCSG